MYSPWNCLGPDHPYFVVEIDMEVGSEKGGNQRRGKKKKEFVSKRTSTRKENFPGAVGGFEELNTCLWRAHDQNRPAGFDDRLA